jgi:hypothetical protein
MPPNNHPTPPIHLWYCLNTATFECGMNEHPQTVMRTLGITYQHAVPQSIADRWWFFNCSNIPDPLPKYLAHLDIDPMRCIGFGLSQKTAEKIRDYDPTKEEAPNGR